MTKASDNPFPSILVSEQGSAPTTPASGYGRIYCKSTGLFFVGDDGVEIGPLAAGTGGGYTEGAKVYNNAAITLANDTVVELTYNTEVYDTDTIHDLSTNPGRLTCKTAGKYLVVGHCYFANNVTGYRQVQIDKNGSRVQQEGINANVGGGVTSMQIMTILDLAENDYVTMSAYQSSGGSLTVTYNAGFSPYFMMQRIG